jgi:hypothetical protein
MYRAKAPVVPRIEMCGTSPGPGGRDQNRDRKKITGTTTGTGTNAGTRGYITILTLSIFVRHKSLYSKKRAEKC